MNVIMVFLSELKTNLLAYCIIFPIFLIITLVNQCVRMCLSLSLIFYKCKLATGMDNMYKVQPEHGTILVVLYCDNSSAQEWDISQERDNFEKKVLQKTSPYGRNTYAKLKKVWCQKFGYGCWEDVSSSFDIKEHIKEEFGGNEGPISEESLLSEILPPLCSSMSVSRPQWEWLIIRNVSVPGLKSLQTVRVFRFHHSYMDGVSVGVMFADFMQFEKTFGNNKSPFVVDPFKPLSFKYRVTQVYNRCIAPLLFPRFLLESMAAEANVPVTTRDPFITKEYSGKFHVAQSKLVEADLFRRIKENQNFLSIQSILCTVFKIGVQKIPGIQESGTNEDIVRMLTTFAMLPVSNRSPRNDFLFTQNAFSVKDNSPMSCSLNTNAFITRFFIRWACSLPIKLASTLLASNNMAPSTFLTNVPFTRVEAKICGSRIGQLSSFVAILPPLGFAIAVTRYEKYFRFCGTCDDRCMDRLNFQGLIDSMASEIEYMASTGQVDNVV